MDKKQNTPLETEQNVNGEKLVSESRRRFSRAVAGSGVVLSLASKPVMGSNYWCTGSGGMSGNTSSHGTKLVCVACSPGFWKGSPGSWAAPYYPYRVCNCSGMEVHPATTFLAAFGAGPSGTMMTILKNNSGSREFHAIGALLNAAKAAAMGLASAYTVFEVQQLYVNGAPKETFSSTWEGALHNCTLPNSNGSIYLAENLPFCMRIKPNGDEDSEANHC